MGEKRIKVIPKLPQTTMKLNCFNMYFFDYSQKQIDGMLEELSLEGNVTITFKIWSYSKRACS